MFWHQATIQLETPPARLSSGDRGDSGRASRAAPRARGFPPPVSAAHLRLACHQRERRPRRARRPRALGNQAVPEEAPYFEHTTEGPDDMPAHVKSALFGVSLHDPGARRASCSWAPGRASTWASTATTAAAAPWWPRCGAIRRPRSAGTTAVVERDGSDMVARMRFGPWHPLSGGARRRPGRAGCAAGAGRRAARAARGARAPWCSTPPRRRTRACRPSCAAGALPGWRRQPGWAPAGSGSRGSTRPADDLDAPATAVRGAVRRRPGGNQEHQPGTMTGEMNDAR